MKLAWQKIKEIYNKAYSYINNIWQPWQQKLTKDRSSLKTRVKKAKKDRRKDKEWGSKFIEFFRGLKNHINFLWVPSPISFLVVSIPILLFWFFVHNNYIAIHYDYSSIFPIINNLLHFNLLPTLTASESYTEVKFKGDAGYQDLIAVHTGIGAVLIGLAFFVAQSMADTSDPLKGKVLLYKSFFFPLLTAEILIFLLFIWWDVNIWSTIPVIVIALFTIMSLYNTITILLKEYAMEKAKAGMFVGIITGSFEKILDWQITQRIGNNILINEYKDNPRISINIFTPPDKDNYIPIKPGKEGIVTDISLKTLDQVLARIPQPSQNINTDINQPQNSQNKFKQEPSCYLVPCFYNEISHETILIWVKKGILLDKDINNTLKNKIFTIKKIESPEKEAKNEITKIKKNCIQSIKNTQTDELKKNISYYNKVITVFFNYMKAVGGSFSQQQAEIERNSFFGRLKPIIWLSEDIKEIFDEGMNSTNMDILLTVAYLPSQFMQEAIKSKDHLVFQEFIRFQELLYLAALEKRKDD